MGFPVVTTIGLSTHIWNNNLRCILLLALYPLLLLCMFWGIAFVFGGAAGHIPGRAADMAVLVSFANGMAFEFLPVIITVVAVWFTVSWFFHTRMIRSLSHSHPVSRQEEPELYNLLENLCIAQGMPMPKLEIIETHARNAFASGISEKTYTVTVTRGLMNALRADELEAVLAHELTHILNRDVRLLIVTVIFTGLFGFLAQIAWSHIRYSLFYTRGHRKGRDNSGGMILVFLIAVILWLGYLASLLMRFALSRRREYMADAGAVEMTKNPDAMMRALMRIAGRDRIPQTTDDIAMMCIENHVPFLGVFSTHPPIEVRIKAISDVTNTPVPGVSSLAPAPLGERFSAGKSAESRPNPWLTRDRRK